MQDRQWLLVQVLQVEQPCPEQFFGCGVVGDEVHGERGLRDPVDGTAVEGGAVEQQEHAEAHHDDGRFPTAGDEDSHVVPQQGQRCGRGGIEKEEAEPDAGHQPDLLGGERHHMPLVGGNEDEHVDEAENIVCQRLRSRNEAGQSPDDQHGRGQREVVFAAERLQSLGREGERRQEDGVGGVAYHHRPMLNGMTLFTMSFILRSARSNTR